MRELDWTVPMDDLIVGALRTCTGCGIRPSVGQTGIFPGPVAVAYWLCAPCAHRDREAVETMLSLRYQRKGV